MEYSPVSDLIRVLSDPSFASLFIAAAAFPWLGVLFVRADSGNKTLGYKATFWAAATVTGLAIVSLLTLGPSAGLSPAGIWYFAFLYTFVPAWLLVTLLLWRLLHRLRRFNSPDLATGTVSGISVTALKLLRISALIPTGVGVLHALAWLSIQGKLGFNPHPWYLASPVWLRNLLLSSPIPTGNLEVTIGFFALLPYYMAALLVVLFLSWLIWRRADKARV